jgi:hypothetical protein
VKRADPQFAFSPVISHRISKLPADVNGFIVNPVAATIFFGLVLIVVAYSLLDQSGVMDRLGPYGPVLPMLVIVWFLAGIYYGVKRLKRRAAKIRLKGPLFMRALMNDCLRRTCGRLIERLEAPELSSSQILNDILTDKVLFICKTDCLRFSDIRRQIERSNLKGTVDLELASLFQTPVEYEKQDLPGEIRQVADTVSRSRSDLADLLERIKSAHKTFCTAPAGILSLLPPDEKKADEIRATYRYRPPTRERARRMAFSLEAMAYLTANRHANVNPMDRKRYDTAAARAIPELADALNVYKRAWQDLVDVYERPKK